MRGALTTRVERCFDAVVLMVLTIGTEDRWEEGLFGRVVSLEDGDWCEFYASGLMVGECSSRKSGLLERRGNLVKTLVRVRFEGSIGLF